MSRPDDAHTAPPTPVDVDLAVLLAAAKRRGVRVWRAGRDGTLAPITTNQRRNT